MGLVTCIWLAAALAAVPDKRLRVNRALRTTHSRRATNRFIAEGRIRVNGIPVSSPDSRLNTGDMVEFDGRSIAWEETALEPHRYLKFNKPEGVVCTTDIRVDQNIIDALGTSCGGTGNASNNNATGSTRRIFPIGRLDAESTGLILLTSDGSIVNPLLRAGGDTKSKIKEYHVDTNPIATDAEIRKLARGIVITTMARRDGGMASVTAPTLPCLVERIGGRRNHLGSTLRFVLEEGRNRQIRRMCCALGLKVTTLHRVTFAGVSLEGCEGPGEWARLTQAEEIAIGAQRAPTRNELRTPEEIARRKAKKMAKILAKQRRRPG